MRELEKDREMGNREVTDSKSKSKCNAVSVLRNQPIFFKNGAGGIRSCDVLGDIAVFQQKDTKETEFICIFKKVKNQGSAMILTFRFPKSRMPEALLKDMERICESAFHRADEPEKRESGKA